MKTNLTPELIINILCGIIAHSAEGIDCCCSCDPSMYSKGPRPSRDSQNLHREIDWLKAKNRALEQEVKSLKSNSYSSNYIKEGF